MDRNHRDGSSAARRDEAVAQRLGYALEKIERLAPNTGECLEPEQIAAYEQRSLSTEELAQCESHLAACSRCRQIFELVAAADAPLSAPTREAAAADGDAALVVATRDAVAQARPQPAQPRPSWWRSLWLVPALAASAAVVLFFVAYAPWRSSERQTSSLIAEAPTAAQPQPPSAAPTEPPATAEPFGAPPSASPPEQGSASGGRPAFNAAAPSSTPLEAENFASSAKSAEGPEAAPPISGRAVAPIPPPSANAAAAPSPPPPAASATRAAGSVIDNFSDAPQSAGASTTQTEGQAAGASASPAEPAPAPSPAMRTPRAPAASPAAPASAPAISARQAAPTSQSARASQAAPANQSAPARLVGALSRQLPAQPQLSVFFLSVTSPSSAVSWRAGAGGVIQRSSDGGRTWQSQSSPLAQDWLAGSAVSDTACWLVGRNGAIARTIDGGRSWQQIPGPAVPADAGGKQPDWVSVTATDAQTAVIGSSSQSYVTRNAGQTWQPQPQNRTP